MSQLFKTLACILCIAGALGCSRHLEKWQLKRAIHQTEEQNYSSAVDGFSRVMRRSPGTQIAIEAARRGAKVSYFDLKDYGKAAEFYRHLVLHSNNGEERVAAQKSLVEIYFEKLLNYDQALQELSRLLPLVEKSEKPYYQLEIAKSYFNLNNLQQSLAEIDDLMSKRPSSKTRYEALIFKVTLLQASKSLDAAIQTIRVAMNEFPDLAKRDNLGMILAVSYEEKGDLAQAVTIMQGLKVGHSNPEFIESRISNLKERMANLPGAQGFKK